MVCLLREKNQLEQVQICSQLEIILTFSRKCLFYRIFTLPNFTLSLFVTNESLKCFVLKVLMLPPLCISFDVIIPTPLFLGGRIKVLYYWPEERTQGYTKVLTNRKP